MPTIPLVEHVQDADLDRYLGDTLEPARATYIRSHILECKACKKQLSEAVTARLAMVGAKSKEARKDRRVARGDAASVQTVCPISFEQIEAELVDESKNGYLLRMPTPLARNTIAILRVADRSVVATVRHCRNSGGATYDVGFQLQAGKQGR